MAMEIEMPEFVDDQAQILWWEMDEFAAGIGIFGIFLIVHQLLIGCAAVFFVMPFVKKIKGDGLPGSAYHYICTTGLVALNKEVPDLLERDLFL